MSLTYPLSFPSVKFTSFNLRFIKSVAFVESPFSYNQQVHDFGGGRWEASVTTEPLSYTQARALEAFFIGLEGRKGTFTLSHPLHTTTMSATTATGSKGDTDLTFSQEVSAGTYFSIANSLYMATETGTTDVNIQPPLRANASSASVDFTQPPGTWRLASNEVEFPVSSDNYYIYNFACVEAF